LILFRRCRKEVPARFGLSQIEVQGNRFLAVATDGDSAGLGDNFAAVLIAGDCNRIPAGCAETRQENRQPDEARWQRHRLQLAGLFASGRADVP